MCHDDCPYPIRGGASIQELDVLIPLVKDALPTFVMLPDQLPAPAILLLHDVNGANDFYKDVARRLANEGYIVALADLFFRQGPPVDASREAIRARAGELVQADTLADISSTLYWLRDHQGGTGEVGTIGFCMGGTLVMLATSRLPQPAASVAFYGFPFRERSALSPLLASDEDEVANSSSPLLGLWGDGDAGVGMDNVESYDQLLSRYGKDHDFVIYPDVGHGFLTFNPTSPAFSASEQSWKRALAHFETHFATTPSRPA